MQQCTRDLGSPMLGSPLCLAICSDVAVCLVTGNLEPIGWCALGRGAKAWQGGMDSLRRCLP